MKKFPLGRIIAHAGGNVSGRNYTNSVEAFERSAPVVSLIEFDVLWANDGLIIAHGGLEESYGLKVRFSKVSIREFKKQKYLGTFSLMSLSDLCFRLIDHDTHVVLDLKCYSDKEYRGMLEEISRIAQINGVQDKIIPQVYSPDNYDAATELGFRNTILALWKNYNDVRTDQARDCLVHCLSGPAEGFRGLSIHARHFALDGGQKDSGLSAFFFDLTGSVFVHGQKREEEEELLARGLGLYSHYAVDWVQHLSLL